MNLILHLISKCSWTPIIKFYLPIKHSGRKLTFPSYKIGVGTVEKVQAVGTQNYLILALTLSLSSKAQFPTF